MLYRILIRFFTPGALIIACPVDLCSLSRRGRVRSRKKESGKTFFFIQFLPCTVFVEMDI